MKILHVITSLGYGGAEYMLYRMLRTDIAQAHDHYVVSLTNYGPPGKGIAKLGVPVEALGLSDVKASMSSIWRLQRVIRRERPDIVQTWMYHSDLLGGLAATLTGTPVVWGIHNTTLDPLLSSRITMMVQQACARISSYVPDAIVSCSEAGWRIHVDVGYDASKFHVIPNGFDLETFVPSPTARMNLRSELRLPASTPLIGIAARFNPQKDLPTFLTAAALLHKQRPDVHFVMAGGELVPGNEKLKAWIDEQGIGSRVHLLGPRTDIHDVFAALDILAMTSYSEAFPLVLGEAMACEVPCVATDVGDAALIIGDTGLVVPPRSPEATAEAWFDLLERTPEERASLGRAARKRIAENYTLDHIAVKYTNLYKDVLARRQIQDESSSPGRELAARIVSTPPVLPKLPAEPAAITTPSSAASSLPDVGALVVSLDFELLWGQQDLWPVDGGGYREQLLGTRTVIPRMLELFDEFGIRATWATVGMLFAESRDELEQYLPEVRPRYEDSALSPYQYEIGRDEEEDPLHFAPSLIDTIRQFEGQEIGTHTFGHYYCLEPGHTPAAFRADLDAARAIALERGIEIESIVLPRNQYAPALDEIMLAAGISCCRGNRTFWPDRGAPGQRYFHPARRIGRIVDTYVPVDRHNSSAWEATRHANGMVDVPANRLVVPRHPMARARLLQRIAGEMRAAAAAGRIYHIWWHPENYGLDHEGGLAFLRSVFEIAAECKTRYGMQSLSMSDVASLVRSHDEDPTRLRSMAQNLTLPPLPGGSPVHT